MSTPQSLQETILAEITQASDLKTLEDIRVGALGKKGPLSALMKQLGSLSPEERKAFGQEVNQLKQSLTEALGQKKEALEAHELEARLQAETIDVTKSVRPDPKGSLHPISQTIEEIVAILGEMGFTTVEGPEIEDDWHNFSALNMPADHPARQMQDTFFMKGHRGDEGSLVLRTHTSNLQIRTMETQKPPIRIIAPGKTYRSDSDATHSPMFHQVEGLIIDKGTHMGHLKGCLIDFCKTFFGLPDLKFRFRPSYFPFTEPSMEVDINCTFGKDGLTLGEGKGWLEVLGAGMVHSRVLENCGLDPQEYQGFAFGMGIERLAMLKYGIPDLRSFFETDKRWLEHYSFASEQQPSLLFGLGE